jgi:hypothetical protein
MGQWIELALRKEQFDMIVDCLESACCRSDDYYDIESYVYLIEDLHNQEQEYYKKLHDGCDIEF